MQTPWLQEPYYGTVPDAGNALLVWIKAHQGENYIDNTGQPIIQYGAPGTWSASGDSEFPFMWHPNDPNDPKNAIYKAGIMYTKGGGINKWVPNAECMKAIAEQNANPLPIPDFILHPTPTPTPTPGGLLPPEFTAEVRALFAKWGI